MNKNGLSPEDCLAGGGEMPERILVVDDNADMREYLSQLLHEWDVGCASDGLSALQSARQDPPSLIVTDVMMPGLDGFQLLEELRRDPRTEAIPVLMLSARAGEEARVSGLEAGVDDYIIKPFSARELTARVASLLNLSRARREADEQKQHLRSLLLQAPTPIVILRGRHHVVELANPLTCRIWGRSEEEVIEKPLLDVVPELRDQSVRALLDGVLHTGIPYIGKEIPARLDRRRDRVIRDDLFQRRLRAAARRAWPGRGDSRHRLRCHRRVTSRNEVNRLRAAAEAANRTKDEFLAMLGHELRNPLAPILTALELMTLRGDTSLLKERTVIDRQVRHLARLVDDLLDMSRIARGKVELRQHPVDLADIVAAAVEGTSPLLEERQHRLELNVARGLMVRGDPTRWRGADESPVRRQSRRVARPGHRNRDFARDGADHLRHVYAGAAGARSVPRRSGSGPQDRQEPRGTARRHGRGAERGQRQRQRVRHPVARGAGRRPDGGDARCRRPRHRRQHRQADSRGR